MSAGAAVESAELRTTRSAQPGTHIPALDGLRGIAVLLVVICHISEQFRPTNIFAAVLKGVAFAGWTGVDLFFVLSGFLITGILWDAKGKSAYFRNFYARRTVRIFPLYYAALVIFFVLAPAVVPRQAAADRIFQDLLHARHYWAWYGTYLLDVLIAWKGFMFAGHFWSLAVEEHFYLVWPLLVHRLQRQTLVSISLALIAGALVLRTVLALCKVSPVAIYVLTPCRMDALALGAVLALVLRGPNGLETLLRFARMALPLSGALWATLLFLTGGWSQYGFLAQTLGYLITEVFYASLLVFTLSSSALAAALSMRPLRLLGKVSYAVYVFHGYIAILCARLFAVGDANRPSILFSLFHAPAAPGTLLLLLDAAVYPALVLALTVGTALLSWYALERPCLGLKRFFPYGGRYNASD